MGDDTNQEPTDGAVQVNDPQGDVTVNTGGQETTEVSDSEAGSGAEGE